MWAMNREVLGCKWAGSELKEKVDIGGVRVSRWLGRVRVGEAREKKEEKYWKDDEMGRERRRERGKRVFRVITREWRKTIEREKEGERELKPEMGERAEWESSLGRVRDV